MSRRFSAYLMAALLAACLIHPLPLTAESREGLSRGVSELVFHLTAYDAHSRPLRHGQGVVIGPQGTAVVSVTTLEGSAEAVAVMMDGTTLSVQDVLAVDEVSGLAKVRLSPGAPGLSVRPIETGVPLAGERVLFSSMTPAFKQVCVQCTITSLRKIPDLEGYYYVKTSLPLPGPGGSVYDGDGRMVGIVLMNLDDERSGFMVSSGPLSSIAGRSEAAVALGMWDGKRSGKWFEKAWADLMRGRAALWEGYPHRTLDLLEGHMRDLPYPGGNMAALAGEAYLAMGDLPKAIQSLERAIDLGQSSACVIRNLIWAHMEAGQFTAAEALCAKAVQADPENPSGYTIAARLYNKQGFYSQAIHEARRALLRDPDCACAHFERGRAYSGLGRHEAAAESLRKATRLDPEYSAAFSSLGYALLRNGEPLQAIVVLKIAVKLKHEMPQAWDSLGEAYSKAGLPDQALDALRMAVCLDPTRSHGYCRLARELMKQGDHLGAVDIVRQGFDRCEGSQWLVFYLGKALAKEGRIDLARAQARHLAGENKELAAQLFRIINAGPNG